MELNIYSAVNDLLPSGFDYATRAAEHSRTPASAAVIHTGLEPGELAEAPGSPEIERAEQATFAHRFHLRWGDAISYISSLPRGVLLQDSNGVVSRVLSARTQRMPGGNAQLEVVSEGVNLDPPPDEFSIEPVELGVHIIKHPRYFYAFLGEGVGSETERINQVLIRLLLHYFENPTPGLRTSIVQAIKDSIGQPPNAGSEPSKEQLDAGVLGIIPGTDLARRAALEIIHKYWRNTETPYIVGFVVHWTQYYWAPQALNPGGYIEDPLTALPPLPDYFAFRPDGVSVFGLLAKWNPQCYETTTLPPGSLKTQISWLRRADVQEFSRTWFRVTRSWMGAPVGYFDTELYGYRFRPTRPDDFIPVQ